MDAHASTPKGAGDLIRPHHVEVLRYDDPIGEESEGLALAGIGLVERDNLDHLRFPGQSNYHTGGTRPVIDDQGQFTWERRTAKKIYVYVSVESVRSNRITIPAR